MVTVHVCSKLKTSWKLVVLTNKVGKNSRYFVGIFNKTIIPLVLVRYEMIMANLALCALSTLSTLSTILYPKRTRGIIIVKYTLLIILFEQMKSHSVDMLK